MGTQVHGLKLNLWRNEEDESMDPQWPAGQDFVYHQWMNAILHCTPGQKVWDKTLWEEK